MVNLWHVQDFPDCRNTKAIMKPIGVTCPTCKEGQVVERKVKRDVFSSDVTNIRNVNMYLGISQLPDLVRNVTIHLVEKKSKKGVQIQCTECEYKEDIQ